MHSDTDDEELTDTQGLERAYASSSRIYRKKSSLYIAGTIDPSDVTQDWIKIPLHNVPNTSRYKTASKYLDSHEGQGIDRVVGHSLGGVVAGELERQRHIKSTQYGSPVVDVIPRNPFHKPDRVACRFDPVAALDYGAKKVDCPDRLNQHSYKGLDKFRRFSYFNISSPFFSI